MCVYPVTGGDGSERVNNVNTQQHDPTNNELTWRALDNRHKPTLDVSLGGSGYTALKNVITLYTHTHTHTRAHTRAHALLNRLITLIAGRALYRSGGRRRRAAESSRGKPGPREAPLSWESVAITLHRL